MLYLLFLIQIIALFFLTKQTTNQIFYFFRTLGVEERMIFIIVSLLFLPGTIIHELAHFFAAMILFMKVRDLKIFPEFEDNEIKLGRVLYEKKDFVRGVLVGIAPIFAGMFFFWMIAYYKLFPNPNLFITIFLGYLVFAVSSTMFSSKQDLVDIIYIIPLIIIAAGVIYVFDLRFDWLVGSPLVIQRLLDVVKDVNIYLFLSLMINGGIIVSLKTGRKLIKK
jgi:hypothetical protein